MFRQPSRSLYLPPQYTEPMDTTTDEITRTFNKVTGQWNIPTDVHYIQPFRHAQPQYYGRSNNKW